MKKAAGVLTALFLLLSGCGEKPELSDNTLVYEMPKVLQPFELTDQNGQAISNQAFKDHWNLLFLGYTSCPDICPLTLAKLKRVEAELKDQVSLKVWFISVDPARDTPDKRGQYAAYFSPQFLAVSAEHKALFPFVRDLGLIYAINEGKEAEYQVDHSASVALVDGEGRLRAIFKPEFKKGQPPTINPSQLITEIPLITSDF